MLLLVSSLYGCSALEDSIGRISTDSEARGGASGDRGQSADSPDLDGTHLGGAGAGGAGGADVQGCISDVPLKHRAEGTPVSAIGGDYEERSATTWAVVHNGDYVTLSGQGYLALRWYVNFSLNPGEITPPRIDVASGLFLRVGGGGERKMDDPLEGTTGTSMGSVEEGLSYMAEGVETPWKNEFYYLDGEVTITNTETGGSYNVTIYAQTYEEVTSSGWGVYEPGVVCDFDLP